MAELIDLTGQRFGRLTVISKAENRKSNNGKTKTFWKCLCDCGNETEVDGQKLRKGTTKSCGCMIKENKGSQFNDLTGQRFGRLVVDRFIPPEERTTRGYNWECVCDCGNRVKANAYKLNNGLQKSCGCLKEEMKDNLGNKTRKYKHNIPRLYGAYRAMIARCYDKNGREWHNYGGRGITVCEEWLNDYDAFAEWALKNGYDAEAERGQCTLDRIDTNGIYEPDNCRWISNAEQQMNRRVTKHIEYNGVTHTIPEWAKIIGITRQALSSGLKRHDISYYFER